MDARTVLRAKIIERQAELDQLHADHRDRLREDLPRISSWEWRESCPEHVVVVFRENSMTLTDSGHLYLDFERSSASITIELIDAMKTQLQREQATRDAEDI